MRKLNRLFRALVAFGLGSLTFSAHAAELYFFDFDGTIVEDAKEHKGSMKTLFKLFLIPRRTHILIPSLENLPEEVWVTNADLKNIKPFLAPLPDRPIYIGRLSELEDGTIIRPGLYYLDSNRSYERFFTAIDGEDYLLHDFKAAELAATQDLSKTFKGPMWSIFTQLLNDPVSAENVVITSARGHNEGSWERLFNYWLKQKYFRFKPDAKKVRATSREEYDAFDIRGHIANRKLEDLRAAVEYLRRVNFTDNDWRVSADPTKVEKLHYLMFADNNPETVDLVYGFFQEIANRQLPIKLALFNAGTESMVRASGRPRFLIVGRGGRYREATEEERFGEPLHLKTKTIRGEDCQIILSRRTVRTKVQP